MGSDRRHPGRLGGGGGRACSFRPGRPAWRLDGPSRHVPTPDGSGQCTTKCGGPNVGQDGFSCEARRPSRGLASCEKPSSRVPLTQKAWNPPSTPKPLLKVTVPFWRPSPVVSRSSRISVSRISPSPSRMNSVRPRRSESGRGSRMRVASAKVLEIPFLILLAMLANADGLKLTNDAE